MFKRIFALVMCLLTVVSLFSACGGQGTAEPTETTEATQPGEEGKTLKVLTLGHSLAVDCGHMLNLIAHTEGYKEMKIATLYYSGCPLNKHVEFATKGLPEYNLYISSTETPNQTPDVMEDVTMAQAVAFDYWDIIIMQGGVFEIAEDTTYKLGYIQTIQEFVKKHTRNPNVRFAWHMAWATPVDNTLRDKYPYPENNSYYSSYRKFNDDRSAFYNAIAKCVGDNIMTDETFEFMIPGGTALENALSSYLEEKDIHRDYAHASDFGRVIASYTWYCRLVGIDKLDEIKLDAVPKNFRKLDQDKSSDLVLTDDLKAIILESVNNALANPLQMTQSQYTVAPAQ